MRMLIQVLIGVVSALAVLASLGWLGLQVKAPPFTAATPGTVAAEQPVRDDLPAPVQRYAAAVYGDSVPEVQSAIVQGRARLAPTGLPMPTRFRIYYDTARDGYYHDIQATWFTLPTLRIHERLLDGSTIFDLGVLGRLEDDPNTNRAAVQGYWAEVMAWVPAIPLTDTRVQWEAVDDTTARLLLPELAPVEALTARFDPETGLLAEIETMRYQNENSTERTRWLNRALEWGTLDGQTVMVRAQTQWADSPPWATWEIEQVALNANVSARMAQFGGDV